MRVLYLVVALALAAPPALAAAPSKAAADPRDAKIAALTAQALRLHAVLDAVVSQRDQATARLQNQLAADAAAAQLAREDALAAADAKAKGAH